MGNTRQSACRIREVFLNGTWIANTNYRDQLLNLDWESAIARVGSLNTIAALAQHIHYYIKGVSHVFKGGSLDVKDKYSFSFPPIQSQQDWENFLNSFWNDAEELASLVEQMPEEKGKEFFVEEKYGTYQRNIDGMIEHGYYHLGQIVQMKKLVSSEDGS